MPLRAFLNPPEPRSLCCTDCSVHWNYSSDRPLTSEGVRFSTTRMLLDVSRVIVGLFSGFAGSVLTVLSISHRVQELEIDVEIDWYGYPFPWLSKTIGGPVLTFEGLIRQATSPPQVNLMSFALDFTVYTLAVLATICVILRLGRVFKVAFSGWRTVPIVDGS